MVSSLALAVRHHHSDVDEGPAWSGLGRAVVLLVNKECNFPDACADEVQKLQALVILLVLCALVVTVSCSFRFLKEDVEELITPLCPALEVRNKMQSIRLVIDKQINSIPVVDENAKEMCSIAVAWPDPFLMNSNRVASTACLQNNMGVTHATLAARSISCSGRSLVLCRGKDEIFGFIEHVGPGSYVVKHRTEVPLLTLVGDFREIDIEVLNASGSPVSWFKGIGGNNCHGKIQNGVDMGLMLLALLATQVHQQFLCFSETSPGALPLRGSVAHEEAVESKTHYGSV